MAPSRSLKISGDDKWLLEFLAVLGSLLCFAGMIILLAFFDNKEIFRWEHITLNTLVSILATATKAGLMMVLAESISQWKWILFSSQRRRLIDLNKLDSASRGLLGSFNLLWSLGGSISIILWIGALATIVSAAFDPFVQQLIQLESRLVYRNNSLVTIPRAQRYAKGNQWYLEAEDLPYQNIRTDADFAMQAAILYGLAGTMNSTTQQLPFNCPSGNCQWPLYDSLAVCGVCNDLTPKVMKGHRADPTIFDNMSDDNPPERETRIPNGCFQLPNGQFLDNFNGWGFNYDFQSHSSVTDFAGATLMTSFSTGNASKTNSMLELDTLIVATSILQVLPDPEDSAAVWPNLPVQATECAIYYCVNQYNSSVINGTLQEEITPVRDARRSRDSWQATPIKGYSLNSSQVNSLEFNNIWSFYNRTDLMLGDEFNVSQVAVDSISSNFQSLLYANFSQHPTNYESINGFMLIDGRTQYNPTAIQAFYDSTNLNDTFKTLATSMTNAIRAGDASSRTSSGTNGKYMTFYSIRWQWISLPGIVIIAGILHLVATVSQTKKMGVVTWKSNLIAVVSRGRYVTDLFEGLNSVRAMNEIAEKQTVNLFPDSDHMSLDVTDGDTIPLRSRPNKPRDNS